MHQEHSKKREGFSTGIGVLAATLGSAVGLGNIWMFPYKTGENGGAAFILVYLICVLLVGLPVMLSEFLIGRKTQRNAIGTFKELAPGSLWPLVGMMGAASSFLIMAFYTTVVGWVFSYIFKSASGLLNTISSQVTTDVFHNLSSGTFEPLIWQGIVFLVVGMIIATGVNKGIERMTKVLMPILFLLLIIVDIRSLTLAGAKEGLEFLFKPDFSKVTFGVILSAMGLAFFKLSVGMGTMITYGSYMGKDQNLPLTTAKVALSDVLVSMMAGIAIFPAVFAFGFQPNSGPNLLFITIPTVFSSMPFGQFFMILFFVLVAIAAMGAMLSLIEVLIAYLSEELKWSRRKATFVTAVSMFLLGSTATLSNSVLADIHVFGKTFFDLYDFMTSNLLLPLGGIIICLFVGWKWGFKNIKQEGSNEGKLRNDTLLTVYNYLVKFIAPIAIAIVLITGLM